MRKTKFYTTKPFWMVWYGVDSRHLHECVGVFDRLKDAQKAYDEIELKPPHKAKRLCRVTEEPYSLKTVKEVLV